MWGTKVQQWFDLLLVNLGMDPEVVSTADRWFMLLAIAIIGLLLNISLRFVLLKVVRKIVSRTKAEWDDIIFDSNVMRRLCNIVTPILIYVLLPIAFPQQNESTHHLNAMLSRAVEIYMVITIVRFINSLLRAIFDLAERKPEWHGRPIKGFMQTGQVIVLCVGVILIISILINRSPAILLTGLGASAAIMSLVFKDSILGLVAGAQLSANNMLKVGDWISMPSRGVDGVVEEVALTVVKVRNWDMTLQMLPPYLLISEPFSNWHAMFESGGRRTRRSINIDMTSVRFINSEDIDKLSRNEFVGEDIVRIATTDSEGRLITNLDLFMRYMIYYLRSHPRVNSSMTLLVRQLQPTEWGLPVELYYFSASTVWANYEQLQSEIISHAVALAPIFDLSLFQLEVPAKKA